MTWAEALPIGVGLDLALALFAMINIASYRRHRPERADVVVDELGEADPDRLRQRPPRPPMGDE
jgi:hypothetical protein